MEIKKLDQKGIDFLIKEEGIILHPYLDSVSIPTISVGCTYYPNGTKVRMTDPPISMDKAIDIFKNVLKEFELTVYSTTRDDITQNQFNALVSICYNIGTGAFKKSTLLKKVNANPNDLTVTDAFKLWSKAGGKPILLDRRIRESHLYFTK